jgi:hypothetical protein
MKPREFMGAGSFPLSQGLLYLFIASLRILLTFDSTGRK